MTERVSVPACPSCPGLAERKAKDHRALIMTGTRLFFTLALALIGRFLVTEERFGLAANFAIMGVAWLISAYDLVLEAGRNLIEKKNPFDENLLMVIASAAAFSLRLFGPEDNEAFEAVMIVFLYRIGEFFEEAATAKSHRSIADALSIRPRTAIRLADGKAESIDPEKLEAGDLILVKMGEAVPADGIIEQGEGSFDMSPLTGEAAPIAKKEGDSVNAGTIVRAGSFTIRVARAYADSAVARIIRLIEEGAAGKSKADVFIRRFARVYTPIAVALACAVGVIPPLFLGPASAAVWSHWLYVAISLLVISCPCAVAVSVPLAYFAGIGLASRHGIVIKGAAYLDRLDELGLLASDKTGTLTKGDFRLLKIVPDGLPEDKFAEYLAAAESRSDHPIAKAIAKDLGKSDIAPKVASYSEKSGRGSMCIYDGHPLIAGSQAFLGENGIAVPSVEDGGAIVYLGVDGRYAGYALLGDTIRKESLRMVAELGKMGVKTVLLTGDKQKSAEKVAAALGIKEVHAELLPEGKAKLLREEIGSSAKAVAYLGDGINDAPSIALADIGVAMGGSGSDLALDHADVVIMNDDPSKLLDAVRIAKKTKKRAKADVAVALLAKGAIAILALAVPSFPLLAAVLADTGLTVLLVINSLLLLWAQIS